MKEGWTNQKIGNICDIYDSIRKPVSKKDRVAGPYPYYGASCVQDYVNKYLFDGRYLLIGEDGAKWGSGDNTAYIAEGKFWVNNHAHILNAKEGYSNDYLCYYFNHFDLTPIVAGAVIPKLTQEKLVNFEVPIPSYKEQDRIVKKLDEAFAKIDALKQNAEKGLQAVKDLWQATLKEELKPKEGWTEYRISDISENLDSKRIPITKCDRSEGIYPYYGASGIVDYVEDYIFDEDLLLVSEDGANLLARSTPIAFSVSGKIWVNNHAHILRFKSLDLQKYIEYYFAATDISPYVTGMAQPKFNQKSLNNMVVYIPNETLIKQIVTKIDQSQSLIQNIQNKCEQELAEYEALKQSILRKAFSGEL
ncbi:MAG: restriction endonuclease subunit S [Paludibacteraceae bacterium]|nr:restriction endonuclease subunit S [Paludibacteraceae bacterium]